ncbi:MAG: hypothetical protein AAFO04_21235 [Cyanobacteria bacterium J06592_8]
MLNSNSSDRTAQNSDEVQALILETLNETSDQSDNSEQNISDNQAKNKTPENEEESNNESEMIDEISYESDNPENNRAIAFSLRSRCDRILSAIIGSLN